MEYVIWINLLVLNKSSSLLIYTCAYVYARKIGKKCLKKIMNKKSVKK